MNDRPPFDQRRANPCNDLLRRYGIRAPRNVYERLISNHMLGHNPVTKIFSVGRPSAAAFSAGDRWQS